MRVIIDLIFVLSLVNSIHLPKQVFLIKYNELIQIKGNQSTINSGIAPPDYIPRQSNVNDKQNLKVVFNRTKLYRIENNMNNTQSQQSINSTNQTVSNNSTINSSDTSNYSNNNSFSYKNQSSPNSTTNQTVNTNSSSNSSGSSSFSNNNSSLQRNYNNQSSSEQTQILPTNNTISNINVGVQNSSNSSAKPEIKRDISAEVNVQNASLIISSNQGQDQNQIRKSSSFSLNAGYCIFILLLTL